MRSFEKNNAYSYIDSWQIFTIFFSYFYFYDNLYRYSLDLFLKLCKSEEKKVFFQASASLI